MSEHSPGRRIPSRALTDSSKPASRGHVHSVERVLRAEIASLRERIEKLEALISEC